MASIKGFFRFSLKAVLFLGLIFVVGGVAGIVFERSILPRLASTPSLSGLPLLKQATENVTVINKTEQVIIREDDTVERIVSQPATAVVNIIVTGDGVTQRTGILLTNDGLIATYENPSERNPDARVTILLYDGTTRPATFVGVDTLTNLSYYRVTNTNTPSIALSNSDDARVGRRLIAIGNSAVEYQNRLAVGILGNENRTFNLSPQTVASTEKWEGVFEMDIPQAEEFIGGPAVGFNGEMVGMIGMETLDGVKHFFLIPSNTVRESLQLAINGKLTLRPVFGAYYLSITKAYAIGNSLSRDRGALIYSPSGRTGLALISGSPAEKAGLRYGDIVIAVNGEEINLDLPFSVALGRFERGTTLELLVLRNGEEILLPVQL